MRKPEIMEEAKTKIEEIWQKYDDDYFLYRYGGYCKKRGGYVVWRDVFKSGMRCTIREAVDTHFVACFLQGNEAIDYCHYMNTGGNRRLHDYLYGTSNPSDADDRMHFFIAAHIAKEYQHIKYLGKDPESIFPGFYRGQEDEKT